MSRKMFLSSTLVATLATIAGCSSGFNLGDEPDPGTVLAETVAKAEAVAQQIGGPNGFGGEMMAGYREHFGPMMGFASVADLADPNGQMHVRLHNESDAACTFRLAYTASEGEAEERIAEYSVEAGETVDVSIPCAEIVGLGSLAVVGANACTLAGGEQFGNEYCVPGFMHADYECGGRFDCYLAPDIDDVDADGDTQELIATTEPLHEHLGPGGLGGHGHGGHHGMSSRR